MAAELTVSPTQPQAELMLALAETRSEPILEVSPIIGSRHKSEYKQVALGGECVFFLTSENKVVRQKYAMVHGSVSLSVDRDDITPSPPHNEYLNSIHPSRDSGDCLIISKEEDTLYASISSTLCSPLPKLHGFHILSVLWLSSETIHKHIALGTKQGNVLEITFSDVGGSPRDVSIVRLLDLDPSTPVTHLKYETFQGAQHLGCVFMATLDGIYFLTGPRAAPESQSLGALFAGYKENPTALRNAMSAAPSPGEMSYLQLFHRQDGSAESFIYLTGSVVMYNSLPSKPESEGSCIVEIKSLPVPTSLREPPQGCGISAQYLFLLYPDRLLVFSRLTLQIASSTLLGFSGCYYRGMIYDTQMEAMLVWSNQGFVVHLQGEGKMQWVYLAEQRKFEESLSACRQFSPHYLPKAKGIYADALASLNELDRAVDLYIGSDKPMEDVIAVLSKKPLGSLQRYLEAVYDRLQPDQLSQRTVVAQAMLMGLLVGKASKADILSLFRKCSRSLDFTTTIQSLQRAGRIDELTEFCREKPDYQYLFRHYLNALDYPQALETLLLCSSKEIAVNLSENALIFVQVAPAAFYKTLVRLLQEHGELSVKSIIPAIRSTPENCLQTSAQFLHLYIETKQCNDPDIHNCYLYHLSQLRDQRSIENYLSKQAAVYQRALKFDFDPDLALSLLLETGLTKIVITLLTHLFRFKEAVKKALDIGELTLAEKTAAQPMILADLIHAEMEKVTILTQAKLRDFAYLLPPHIATMFLTQTPQRKDIKAIESHYHKWSKALWLQIAAWHQLRGDNQAVLMITGKNQMVEFSDVVPYLTEKVPFGEIREQVKMALRKYAEDIAYYKKETEACRHKAELIRKEREKKANECIQGDVTQPCVICSRPMNRESAFLFPCLHAFHESCLVQFYRENRVQGVSDKVGELVERLRNVEKPEARKELRRELLDLLSLECSFCSESYIDTIKLPLVSDLSQLLLWDLSPTIIRSKGVDGL